MVPEKMLGYSNFWAWWKRVESEAGVRHRKPHMMRHTFATDVLDATEGTSTPSSRSSDTRQPA